MSEKETQAETTKAEQVKASEPPKIQERQKSKIMATGLEDYVAWQAIYQNHQRNENEPPFRRGRIWA